MLTTADSLDALIARSVWKRSRCEILYPASIVATGLSTTPTFGPLFSTEEYSEMLMLLGYDNPSSGSISTPKVYLQVYEPYKGTWGYHPDLGGSSGTALSALVGTSAQVTDVLKVTSFGAACRIGFSAGSTPTLNGNIQACLHLKCN